MHDDNPDGPFLLALSHSLQYAGWQADDAVPPVYRLPSAGLMIEIEPGGADTSGHYLHLIDIRGERDRPGPVRAAFDRVREAMSSALGFTSTPASRSARESPAVLRHDGATWQFDGGEAVLASYYRKES